MQERDRPLVTIAIPTYNRADGYLRGALESALAQTYPNLEIIVSDNNSTDDTEALVRGMDDPRIRYVRHASNIGVTNNWNYGVQHARGAYILLLHDDDLIDADFVSSCMDAVEDDRTVGIIRSGTRFIDGAGRVRGERENTASGLDTAEFFLGLFRGEIGSLNLCSTLYNAEALRSVGGFHSRAELYQDVVVTAKLASSHGRADVRDVKASFRRHDGNFGSAQRIADWCDDSLFVLDVMAELAPAHAAAIRREGMRYFSRSNYGRASRIGSLVERIRAYWTVYRTFGFALSPLDFYWYRAKRRWERFVGRDSPQYSN